MRPQSLAGRSMTDSMKLVILDRDGVINHDSSDYIKMADEWQPIPGSLGAIAALNNAGVRVVVASNQAGLGRGLLDIKALNIKEYRIIEHFEFRKEWEKNYGKGKSHVK